MMGHAVGAGSAFGLTAAFSRPHAGRHKQLRGACPDGFLSPLPLCEKHCHCKIITVKTVIVLSPMLSI